MVAHYGKRPCRICGRMVTNNALGRASHERACIVRKDFEANQRSAIIRKATRDANVALEAIVKGDKQ
jgi:hypothetical protein